MAVFRFKLKEYDVFQTIALRKWAEEKGHPLHIISETAVKCPMIYAETTAEIAQLILESFSWIESFVEDVSCDLIAVPQ